MTHISQFAVKDFDAYENSNELKEYQVEVITFYNSVSKGTKFTLEYANKIWKYLFVAFRHRRRAIVNRA